MTTKNNIKEINHKNKVSEDMLLSSISTLGLWFEQNYINTMKYEQEWKKESEYKRFIRTLSGVCESLVYQKNKYIVDFKLASDDKIKKDIVVKLNNIKETKYIPTLKRISKP